MPTTKNGELNFAQIDAARKLLGLGEQATLTEIKKAYRQLCKKWHPDKNVAENDAPQQQVMQEINKAYEVLITFCRHYNYSFKKEDILTQDPYQQWWERFVKNDPIWGFGGSNEKPD